MGLFIAAEDGISKFSPDMCFLKTTAFSNPLEMYCRVAFQYHQDKEKLEDIDLPKPVKPSKQTGRKAKLLFSELQVTCIIIMYKCNGLQHVHVLPKLQESDIFVWKKEKLLRAGKGPKRIKKCNPRYQD